MSTAQTAGPVDPAELKPGRIWYWIAGVVIVVGVAAGVAVFVFGVTRVAESVPEMEQTFAAGEDTEMELSGGHWAIYVDHPGESAPTVECVASSPDDEVLVSPSDAFTTSDGRHTWHMVYELTVTESGPVEVNCDTDAKVGDFAIGEAVDVSGFVGGILGSITGLIGIPTLGIVVGGTIILVVALRRSAHRKRLRSRPSSPGAW